MAEYGRRLLVRILESEANSNPERVFASTPVYEDLSHGYREVTFRQVKSAVDQIVHLLRQEFVFSTHETVAYIGVSDLRYHLFFYAALKCRLKALLLSSRNSLAVNGSLLDQTECKKFIHTEGIAPAIATATAPLQSRRLPGLAELLAGQAEHVPYNLDYFGGRDEPILILHSSGSTGAPKPVTITHGFLAAYDSDHDFPIVPGRTNLDFSTWDTPMGYSCSLFPLYHLAGFAYSIVLPLYTGLIPILGPVRPPSTAMVAEIIRLHKVHVCFLPPTIIVDLYYQPNGLQILDTLEYLIYSGGPLPDEIGDQITKHHVTLCQSYGATEIGCVRQLVPLKEDWQYMEFHPNENIELQSVNDAYEMVIHADKKDKFSFLDHTYPGLRDYRTKDLFQPHPAKPGLWKFHARTDDIIVLSSGEKINPLPFESALTAVKGIIGAVVVGQGQPRAGLLLEVEERSRSDSNNLVANLWPTIHALNKTMPSHGHVSKSMIFVTCRPFIRSGKGTVIRKLTIAAHNSELRGLFTAKPVRPPSLLLLHKSLCFSEDVKDIVRSTIHDTLDATPADDEDLFRYALDSIKSLEVIEILHGSIEPLLDSLSVDVIYNHPTIDGLSTTILKALDVSSFPTRTNRAEKFSLMPDFYLRQLPRSAAIEKPRALRPLKKNVILVGSTGYLGRHMLEVLACDPYVHRIYCLDRSSKAQQKWLDQRVACTNEVLFYQVQFSEPAFGLTENVQQELAECQTIIHLPWQVNFLLPLSQFSDSLNGLVNSLDLATKGPRLLFASSVSAAAAYTSSTSEKQLIVAVPEASMPQGASLPTGYGESKLLAERLVIAVTTTTKGVQASILRLGQIAPPQNHHPVEWPAKNAVTAMFDTSRALGLVPRDMPDVDWMPVDILMRSIQDVMHYGPSDLTFYHLVNTCPVPWSEFLPTLLEWCANSVTLKDCIAAVKAKAHYSHASLSALPLLPFFELLSTIGIALRYRQEELSRVSPTALLMEPIDPELLRRWLSKLAY